MGVFVRIVGESGTEECMCWEFRVYVYSCVCYYFLLEEGFFPFFSSFFSKIPDLADRAQDYNVPFHLLHCDSTRPPHHTLYRSTLSTRFVSRISIRCIVLRICLISFCSAATWRSTSCESFCTCCRISRGTSQSGFVVDMW